MRVLLGLSLTVLFVLSVAPLASAQERLSVVQDAPLFLLPDAKRQPLMTLTAGAVVKVIRTEGTWLNITFEDRRAGRRTGYIEARFTNLNMAGAERRASSSEPPIGSELASVETVNVPTVPQGPNTTATASAVPAPTAEARAIPRPVADVTLKGIRRIFLEKMANDLDQYISAEITKELSGRLVVVLDKANADAIMRGIGENRTGVGAAITGRYLGLHDNASASITIVDPAETVVLWASEAGDRSLMFGVMRRGGQRKVADRLVNNLKEALRDAK